MVIEGANIIVEEDGKQTGEILGTADYFGETAALFKPGTCSDAKGNVLGGHCRTRTVYASKDEVTVGQLTYETLQALRRERPAISETLVPYANTLAASLRQAGQARPKVTALDCYPELETLEGVLGEKLAKVDERMARIEALLTKQVGR